MRLPPIALFTALLTSCAAPRQSLRIISLHNEEVFSAKGSPLEPYAMEHTRLSLRVRNVGGQPIPRELMLQDMPRITAQDFQAAGGPQFTPNGGYWNSLVSPALEPGETAQVWLQGHFVSSGTKLVTAAAGAGQREARVRVRAQASCQDSHKEDDRGHLIPGWAVGATSCLDQSQCRESTRQEDRCEDQSQLATFRCLPDPAGVRRVYYVPVVCPNGCRRGACLPEKIQESARWIQILAPAGGEVLRPGQELDVVWVSRGIAELGLTLSSRQVHGRGGRHTLLNVAVFKDDGSAVPSRKAQAFRLPADLEAADDWVLTMTQVGADPYAQSSRPFRVAAQ